MECPKCKNPMEPVIYKTIEVNRCTACKGIWFDMLEQEILKGLEGSESIDSGDPEVGAMLDKESTGDCPVCHTQMIAMVDRDQPHIHYESCTSCYGVFFDAGEFRDYKERTVLDFFKDLLARERK